ncbi:Sec23/Sec24 trunk domain-containing protein [Fennellomyces sp. T-0311]|nr:Sec23/Sec24 trunk domain-containing protein [Fennellomyces sp. T-0311]
MNLYNNNNNINSSVPAREDIPLVGQAPPIHDLDLPAPSPQVAENISVTPSPNAQCPSVFKRSTLNTVPASNSLLKKSKLPFALLLEPHPSDVSCNKPVPVVTDTVVARCTRCKTYINPFVRFSQGALKWQCNMCGLDNDVPQAFDWDVTNQQQVDRWSRPELNYGCVDFVASADYMVRPPQPPAFVFIIDTSYQAIQTGMIGIVAQSILQSLDKIPNEDGRTKVALITVDNAVGFYKLSGDEPEMLVVGDLADIYLPRAASDLLVDLTEAKPVIQDLLERMKTMHDGSQMINNCLGTALQAARKLMSSTGGKIVCFQANLPSVGDGVIKPNDEKKPITETTLMAPSNSFYRTFATECAKTQVCADMFIFGSGPFADVATLNVIPRFTGGQTHFYPVFNANNRADAQRLEKEIESLLSEKIGLEAVMRTRCSPGLICKAFHGNCTTRVPDIMALPNVPRDQSYCVEIGIEEDIQGSHTYFQTALLYTTCFGERRIRVINLCLPVARGLPELFASADQTAIARTICHQAIDKAVTYKLRDARDLLAKEVIDICSAYGKEVIGSVASGSARLSMGRNLAMLPFLVLGLLKLETFNEAGTIPVDMRAQTTVLLRTLPTQLWLELVAPKFYCLHSMPQNAGSIDPNTKQFVMPPRLNLSSEKLERHGLYLLEDGQHIYIWIGKEAVPPLCNDFLNVPNITQVQSGQLADLPKLSNPFSQRVTAIVDHIRNERRGTYYPSLYIVKEDGDPMLRAMFLNHLIEDRNINGPTAAGANQQQVNSGMSYFQWLGFVRAKCQ